MLQNYIIVVAFLPLFLPFSSSSPSSKERGLVRALNITSSFTLRSEILDWMLRLEEPLCWAEKACLEWKQLGDEGLVWVCRWCCCAARRPSQQGSCSGFFQRCTRAQLCSRHASLPEMVSCAHPSGPCFSIRYAWDILPCQFMYEFILCNSFIVFLCKNE